MAEQLVERMLGGAPADVVAAMAQAGAEVAIIGKDQVGAPARRAPGWAGVPWLLHLGR